MLHLRTCLVLLATANLVESLMCNAGTMTRYSPECGWNDKGSLTAALCLLGETSCISASYWTAGANGCITSIITGACSNDVTKCTVQDVLYKDKPIFKDYTCSDTCTTDECNSKTPIDPNDVVPFTCLTGSKITYSSDCGWSDKDTLKSMPCILGEESCVGVSHSITSGSCTTSTFAGACENSLTNCDVQDAQDKTDYSDYTCNRCDAVDCNKESGTDTSGSPKQTAATMAILGAVIAQFFLGF